VGHPSRPRLAARLLQELSADVCPHHIASDVLLFCLFIIIYFCYLPLPGG
jgi:hypothetical protein